MHYWLIIQTRRRQRDSRPLDVYWGRTFPRRPVVLPSESFCSRSYAVCRTDIRLRT